MCAILFGQHFFAKTIGTMRFVTILFLLVNQLSFSQTKPNWLDSIAKRSKQTHSTSVLIYQDGKILLNQPLSTMNEPNELMSVTKSIVGLAVGKMITEHLIDSLDVPVWIFYPEWKQGLKEKITLRHLLTHTSGIQNVENASKEIYPSKDFVQLALAADLTDTPGVKFQYNNKAVNLLAGIIKKATSKRMDLYIKEKLFLPLGITDFKWQLDKSGNPHVMAGCQLSASSILKTGKLILANGYYDNKEIISSAFISEMMKPQLNSPEYGLLWWLVFDRSVSVVTQSSIDKLKAQGAPEAFLMKAPQLIGEYENDIDFEKALRKVFGAEMAKYISFIQNMRTLRQGNKIGIAARGYLGNYFIIIPSKKIIAIRTISAKQYTSDFDSFYDFESLVVKLSGN
ncbi:MAG: beta-lactamase family protein [Bacteroidota bacterium]|nr:beta-lactamase family protein [Bacteroidota bacterium]